MLWKTAAALLGAGGDIATAFINRETAKQTNKEQFEYNKQLSELAYKQNIEQWNRENAYNTPAQQVARLVSAGLNPNMAYGTPGVVSSTSADSPQMNYERYDPTTPQLDINGPALSDSLINAFLAEQTERRVDNETAKTVAEIESMKYKNRLSNVQADKIIQDIEYKPKEFDLSRQETLAKINQLNADAQLAGVKHDEQAILNQFTATLQQAQIAESYSRTQLNRQQIKQIDSMISVNYARIAEIQQNINLMITQGQLNEKTIQKLSYDMNYLKTQTSYIAKQTGIAEKDIQHYVWQNNILPLFSGAGTGVASGLARTAGKGLFKLARKAIFKH